jgi:hypothetical protein
MSRRHHHKQEIDLSRQRSIEGLEVIEDDPLEGAPEPMPVNLLAGLPEPSEAPYAEPTEDPTGARGIWTAIEHL